MRRRTILAGLLSALAAPLAAEAQPAGKVWRIGTVLVGSQASTGHLLTAIEASLSNAGYVQGRNIVLVQRIAPPSPVDIERELRAIVQSIDVLIVGSTIGGAIAKKVTSLPTVFVSVGDPVRIGLVSSLAHAGGNMTGVTFEAASETYGKRLQLLKEVVPSLRVAGVLRAAGDPNVINAMESIERVAPALRLSLRVVEVNGAEDLDKAFADMRAAAVRGVLAIASALTFANGQRIAELALRYRLPSCHAFRETVAAGGLMSLGPDLVEVVRQAAGYVDKIIKGAKPGDLPVQQPARYELHVNLKTAKALGVTMPQALLMRADQVIE